MATFTALASLLTPLTAQTADAPLNTYTLRQDGTPEAYDEALTVSCLQGLARFSPDTGVEADYIVVEMANQLLGKDWMPDYVASANNGGIERVLV